MEQIRTAVPEQESSFHPRPAAATITDLMQLPPTTVQQHDHAAAAVYLMKHAGTTALMVVDARAGQPTGIITAADIARAIADGKDVNDVWVDAVMTTRPAIIATTSIRDAAEMMTTRHFRHLPVAGEAGLVGVVDITDLCRALIDAGEDDRRPVADPDRAARPGSWARPSSGLSPAAGLPARRRRPPQGR